MLFGGCSISISAEEEDGIGTIRLISTFLKGLCICPLFEFSFELVVPSFLVSSLIKKLNTVFNTCSFYVYMKAIVLNLRKLFLKSSGLLTR